MKRRPSGEFTFPWSLIDRRWLCVYCWTWGRFDPDHRESLLESYRFSRACHRMRSEHTPLFPRTDGAA